VSAVLAASGGPSSPDAAKMRAAFGTVLDLPVLNILRALDHGLADCNSMRKEFGQGSPTRDHENAKHQIFSIFHSLSLSLSVVVSTGARAKPWNLLKHAAGSLSISLYLSLSHLLALALALTHHTH